MNYDEKLIPKILLTWARRVLLGRIFIIGGGIIELVELGVVEGVVLTPDEIGIGVAIGVAVVGSVSG